MPGIRVTYRTKKTGATPDDVVRELQKQFVDAVLEDHRETPDHFAGSGRNGRTPYDRTGELVKGFYFKPATRKAVKLGRIGTICAPVSRFATTQLRNGFIRYLHDLWTRLGVGFSAKKGA